MVVEQLHHAELLVHRAVEAISEGQVALRLRQHVGQVEGCRRFQPRTPAHGSEVLLVDGTYGQVRPFRIMRVMGQPHQLKGEARTQLWMLCPLQLFHPFVPCLAYPVAIVRDETPRIVAVHQLFASFGEGDVFRPTVLQCL